MLDPATLTATLDERTAVLTRREFDVLALLHEADGATVTHDTLLVQVWGPNTQRANLRVAIAGLRRKLEADPELPALILAVPGEGYRLAGAPGPTRTGTSCDKRF
jgi:two-component system, OmpR family, KDP operon response regulator KdpE